MEDLIVICLNNVQTNTLAYFTAMLIKTVLKAILLECGAGFTLKYWTRLKFAYFAVESMTKHYFITSTSWLPENCHFSSINQNNND